MPQEITSFNGQVPRPHYAQALRRVRSRGERTPQRPRFKRFAALAFAYLLFASCVAAATGSALHARSLPSNAWVPGATGAPAETPQYMVLMVLDGGRPDYLDLTQLPHLDALRQGGTEFTNVIDGILEAETPAGHATIATGSRPDRNGILGFDWANDTNRVSLFSPDQMTSLEQIIQDNHAPTIAGLYKQRYPTAKVVALSGHKYYAAAPLGGPSADAIMYYQGDSSGRYVPVSVPGHVPPASVFRTPGVTASSIHLPDGGEDHLATQLALATFAQMRPRIMMINYPEFDWPLGHVDGGNLDPTAVATDMRGFDTDLGKIEAAYQKAGILSRTLFVITADHGMMPITRFIPSTVVTNAVSQAGTTAPDIATNTADYVWLADGTKAQAVAENVIKANDPGIQNAYYLTTQGGRPHYVSANPTAVSAAEEQANQYLLDALLNGHEPTVVLFAKEGQTFSDPSSKWKGDHGGNSWESQHIPLILAGPGIQQGQVISDAAQLEDVAPTVLAAMGVAPTGMDGQILTDALDQSSASAQRARAAEIQWLNPISSTLQAQSNAELGG